MSSRAFVLIDSSSELSSADDSSIEPKIDSYSTKSRSFSNKFPSSNCEKVIILPVYSWDYVAYVMYNTNGLIVSASEYGYDVYTNSLENVSSNTTPCEEAIFCVIGT